MERKDSSIVSSQEKEEQVLDSLNVESLNLMYPSFVKDVRTLLFECFYKYNDERIVFFESDFEYRLKNIDPEFIKWCVLYAVMNKNRLKTKGQFLAAVVALKMLVEKRDGMFEYMEDGGKLESADVFLYIKLGILLEEDDVVDLLGLLANFEISICYNHASYKRSELILKSKEIDYEKI